MYTFSTVGVRKCHENLQGLTLQRRFVNVFPSSKAPYENVSLYLLHSPGLIPLSFLYENSVSIHILNNALFKNPRQRIMVTNIFATTLKTNKNPCEL